MDQMDWVMYGLIYDQMLRDGQTNGIQWRAAQPVPPKRRSAVRGALASALLRAGLLLDPAAGDRLRATRLPQVTPEPRPQA